MKIFFIFGIVLLIKPSLGDAVHTPTSNEFASNGIAFRKATIAKLITLSEEPIKLTKKLLEEAYADKTNSENVTEELAETIRDLKKYDYSHPANRITVFLSMGGLFDILSNYTEAGDRLEKSEKFHILKEALQNHDVKTVANVYRRKFDEFHEWLTQEFEAKRDQLTTEDQLSVNALKELWVQYKDEINSDKRQKFGWDILSYAVFSSTEI